MPRIFLTEICEYCDYYKYKDSDYGRLGINYYMCGKGVFDSTRNNEWYEKAIKCKQFKTRFSLSDERLDQIGRK